MQPETIIHPGSITDNNRDSLTLSHIDKRLGVTKIHAFISVCSHFLATISPWGFRDHCKDSHFFPGTISQELLGKNQARGRQAQPKKGSLRR